MLASRSLGLVILSLALLPSAVSAQSDSGAPDPAVSAFASSVSSPLGLREAGDPRALGSPDSVLGALCIVDDDWEDNDDCGDQVQLFDGFYPDLTVSKEDWDYFGFTVAPGGTLSITIVHLQPVGDIDAFLYPAGACVDFESGDIGCAKALACATTVSDLEMLSYTNLGSECETYILKIYVVPSSATGFCNEYDLFVEGTLGSPLGEAYCPQNQNSTGKVARIDAFGSPVAADQRLTLVARNMPEEQAGFFVVSTSSGAVDLPGAGVSDGLLCLGPETGRFNGQAGKPGSVLSTGPAGTFCLSGIDLSALPSSAGPSYPALAGTSSYFTTWFRDPDGDVGNSFSDAVVIDWQ